MELFIAGALQSLPEKKPSVSLHDKSTDILLLLPYECIIPSFFQNISADLSPVSSQFLCLQLIFHLPGIP